MTAAAFSDARIAPGRVNPERWVVCGVAADLARILRAPVHLIRTLLLVALFFQPTGVLVAYAVTAALLPRGEVRHPSWSGAVALGRLALLLLAPMLLTAGGISVDDLLHSGPAIWVPVGGGALAILIGVIAASPVAGAADETRCRALVLGALPAAAIAAVAAAGMALAPDVRWDRVLPALLVAGATTLVLPGGRAGIVPMATLAGVVLVLASADARLQGGVGSLDVSGVRVDEARRAIGDVNIDLRDVIAPEVDVRASAGVGDVRIVVPRRAIVTADVRVGRGTVPSYRYVRGLNVRRHIERGASTRRRAPLRVRIVAEAGIGTVEIVRSDGQPL
jgi:phage shock protein PspC (stress-responsive transcriptional regulator)